MRLSSTILTVSQFTQQIKSQLETQFPKIAIQGEVSNAKLNTSGHFYFDLKDAEAKISCVMFRSKVASLSKVPKEGDKVILNAALSLYPPQGKYQLIAESLEYQGVGDLLLKLEQLKRKLHEKGYFAKERKKPLPKFPRRIGVVTSPTGAVIRDILNVLSRRYKGFQLLLNPVRVQGNEAAAEIAAAVAQFNRHALVDVIIVARGGGSLEDLWPFNEECVANAIFESRIPIISAVGHETDFTIADFVADVRAPTPSAAAEIVASETAAHLQFLEKMGKNTLQALHHLVKRYRTHLEGYKRQPLIKNPYLIVGNAIQKVDDLTKKIDQKMGHLLETRKQQLQGKQRVLVALQPKTKIAQVRKQLTHYTQRLDTLSHNLIKLKKERLHSVTLRFASLNPKNVLKRGYSILFAQKNNSVIVSAQAVHQDEEVVALLADGSLKLQIKEKL